MPVGDAAGSFFGGLLQGKAQGSHQKMQMEYVDSQKSYVKAQAKALESQLEMEAMKRNILDAMTPEQRQAALFPKADDSLEAKLATVMKFMGGQSRSVPLPPYDPGAAPGTGPTRPGAMSIPDTIARGQMGGMGGLGLTKDDLIRGVLKKELGAEPMSYHRTATVAGPDGNPWVAPMDMMGNLDMSKAMPAPVKPEMQKGVGEGMAPTETPVNPYSRRAVGTPIQTGPPPTMQVETPTAGGGKVRGVVPLFPGGSKVSGTTGGGVRTELDLLDVPIPAAEVTKWSDGQGNNPPVGWTPRQAKTRGFNPAETAMPAETGGKVVMVAQAIQDIEAAEALLFPKPGQFNRKLAFGAQANLPEWAVKDAQIVQSSIQNAIAAKLRVETGAQANDEEIKHIANRFFPSGVRDSDRSARNKLTRLKQFMKDGKFVMDPKGRIVVVEPPKGKPDLSLGKKKDPSKMTDAELLKALQ